MQRKAHLMNLIPFRLKPWKFKWFIGGRQIISKCFYLNYKDIYTRNNDGVFWKMDNNFNWYEKWKIDLAEIVFVACHVTEVLQKPKSSCTCTSMSITTWLQIAFQSCILLYIHSKQEQYYQSWNIRKVILNWIETTKGFKKNYCFAETSNRKAED